MYINFLLKDDEVDIRPYSYHDLTGLLKLYLRELPEVIFLLNKIFH